MTSTRIATESVRHGGRHGTRRASRTWLALLLAGMGTVSVNAQALQPTAGNASRPLPQRRPPRTIRFVRTHCSSAPLRTTSVRGTRHCRNSRAAQSSPTASSTSLSSTPRARCWPAAAPLLPWSGRTWPT